MKVWYKIPSNTKKDVVYNVRLVIINGEVNYKSSCECYKGSLTRFTKKAIEEGKWKCSHIKIAERRYNERQ